MIHILVVDDDKDLNRLVCSYLNDSGFETKGCLSVNEAYDEMYSNLYDLIISDIMMPKIDGFEFAETIRSLNANILILFLSARDDLSSKEKGFRLGIDHYMVKPVELAELEMRVRALLRRANMAESKKLIVGDLTLDGDAMTGTVTTVCNGKHEVWTDYEEAKAYFLELMMIAEGEERDRAECVCIQLTHGLSECSDDDE